MNRRDFFGVSGVSLASVVLGGDAARLFAQTRATQPGPIVDTATGRIRGVIDQGVSIFKGVPYGAAPVGERRFMPAVAPAAWTGVRDVSAYGPRAHQPFRPMIPEIGDALTGSGPMGEDCLR